MRNLLLIPFCFVFILSYGQRVQSLPSHFAHPKYFDNDNDINLYIAEGLSSKVLRQEWIVFSDRVENQTFVKPYENSEKKEMLDYKQYYYVIEKKGKWLRLGSGITQSNKKLSGFIDYGWISCEHLLLWNTALQNENNGIHVKGLTLNKLKNYEEVKNSKTRLIAKIYDGPESDFAIGNINLYNYFFILKSSKDRYLVSKELVINRTLSKEDIIGWVDKDKIHLWRTRLALEPNFDEVAFDERKENTDFQIKAYRTKEDAQIASKGGYPSSIMENDPVNIPRFKMSDTNPRRHKGMVLRYPVIEKFDNVFHSAAVGEVQTEIIDAGLNTLLKGNQDFVGPISSETVYANIHSITNKSRLKRDNVNIFILAQNSKQIGAYKESINHFIKNIDYELLDANIKIGIGIFDDFNIDEKSSFRFTELSSDKRATIGYLNDWNPIENASNEDSWTNLYYALDKSCQMAGFGENSSNIMLVLAENRDFSYDKPRLLQLDEQTSKYKVTETKLAEKFAKFEMNTFLIQPNISSNQSVKKLTADLRSIMINSANNSFNDYSKIKDEFEHFDIPNPSMPSLDGSGEVILQNGIVQSGILYPQTVATTLSSAHISEFIYKNVLKVHVVAKQTHKLITSIIGDGNGLPFSNQNVATGQWNPAVANIIMEYMQDNPEIDKIDIKKVVNEQIKLFHEVYFPSEYNKDAKHSPFKYVAFMPQKDLLEYINTIKRLDEASTKSLDKQREALYSNILELVRKLSGDDLSDMDIRNKSIGYLDYLLQGITDQGYNIKTELNFKIGDIYNLDRNTLQRIYQNFSRSLVKLNKIKGEGLKHEFSYNAGKLSPNADIYEENTYFWIPLDDLLLSK